MPNVINDDPWLLIADTYRANTLDAWQTLALPQQHYLARGQRPKSLDLTSVPSASHVSHTPT